MFNRISVISDLSHITSYLQLDSDNLHIPPVIDPNIGLGDLAPVLVPEKRKHIQLYRFGINAVLNVRAEGDRNSDNSSNYKGMMGIVNGKYRRYMLSQRCAVICDAFIIGEHSSYPYLIYPRDKKRPFLIPAIWDEKNGERSFALITIWGNPLMQALEVSRSPVILTHHREIRAWLDPKHVSLGVSQLLKPWDYNLYNAYPISPRIKDQTIKVPGILKPTGPKVLEESLERMNRQNREMTAASARKKAEDAKQRDLEYQRHMQKLRDQGLLP